MTTTTQAKLAVSVEEAANRLGVSRSTAYAMIKSGKLAAFQISDNRYRVPVAALDAMLHLQPTPEPTPATRSREQIAMEIGRLVMELLEGQSKMARQPVYEIDGRGR